MFWTLLAGNTSSIVYKAFDSAFFPFLAPLTLNLFPPPAEVLALPTVSHLSDIITEEDMKVIMTTELDWTVYAELKIDLLEVWDS